MLKVKKLLLYGVLLGALGMYGVAPVSAEETFHTKKIPVKEVLSLVTAIIEFINQYGTSAYQVLQELVATKQKHPNIVITPEMLEAQFQKCKKANEALQKALQEPIQKDTQENTKKAVRNIH